MGFTFTYMAPLCFVISVTMIKEFFDDYERFQKDKEANSFIYKFLLKFKKNPHFFDKRIDQKRLRKEKKLTVEGFRYRSNQPQ